MKHIQSALVLYPNQLFAADLLPDVDLIYVVEEPLFFGVDQQFPLSLHKQKLVLHRASMRRYVEEILWQNNLDVEYVELEDIELSTDILVRAQKAGAELVYVFDPTDTRLESRLKNALDEVVETPFELRILPTPSFLLKHAEVRDYFAENSQHSFADFYQWQRERFNILIDKKYKPVGGKWSYEVDKPQALPADRLAPGFESFGSNKYVQEAKKWVDKRFIGNPGDAESFFWPTSHAEAELWLDDFIKNRLEQFSLYEDAFDSQSVLMYHSGISALLNTGLLTPAKTIQTALNANQKAPINLTSLEHFIRRILGWREYLRGMYVAGLVQLPSADGQRTLAVQWWDGTTEIPPLDDVIKKLQQHAYATNTERMMIVANLMLLCNISPSEMYKWFSSLCIDTYDWSILPALQGVNRLDDLSGLVEKPYICSSSYVLLLSHYKKDIWCDIWDGLFWGYIENHKDELAKNPHTKVLVGQLAHLNPDRKRIIGYRAADFLTSIS